MNPGKSPHLTFPKIRPEKAVTDYRRSKKFESVKQYPEFDVVRDHDPKSELALLQIKLRDVEEVLEQKRHYQREVRKQLDWHWRDLEKKEAKLRENFINFHTFVHENMEKRDRAFKKVTEERVIINQRQRDINYHIQNYMELNKSKHEMEMKIKEYRLYEDYLQDVVVYSVEFGSIQDMINRYLALVFAKKHLAQVQEDNLRDLEKARNDMMKLMADKHLEIVGLNNHIANLQARYEVANIKCLENEQLVTKIKNHSVQVMNELDEVKSSIWNLYEHMAQSKGHPVLIAKENVEAQMMYIKRTLIELSTINQILRKKSKSQTKIRTKN
ncbi:hypothetical protein NQ318_001909 [Aromia moschata]|uniref:DUF4200 domain-containing protein n=1 Tax=Aromia moschata TaxID=1265417 RepID=A0AAV8Z2N6_9CUCU|nr:hypothetical protein NQ318_001909 [Aromia moschata]